MWKAVCAMVSVELSLALVNILLKKAMNGGMSRVIIVVYRQSVATIFLIPFAFFWERNSWSKLTASLICQMFLCALIGLTLTQYLFLVGLDYTSATFTCAFINIVPVITFLLAWPLRMERVDISRNSGKAKVAGTAVCVMGALLLSVYKGELLINHPRHGVEHRANVEAKRLGPGAAFLAAGSVAWSSWFLMQSKIGRYFPHRYSSTLIMSSFSSFQSALLCFVTDRDFSKWIVRGELDILTVVFSGIVGSGLCYVVMSWCVKRRGPVFTAAFSPLIQIFAAVLDVSVLHEEIYLGSILGSVVVVVGMYVLLWGKSKDQQEACGALPKRIDESHTQQITN
ncbi:WAT1-related protein At3g30340-like [Salvia miltiorrhiza]|uniref:WAT1-related protein At3g30340-like n=1 Tax=Salvia miltiorrhiza TaxID=226208 RepID=UPI0025AC9522|nr:WAT1-related protein At3g30340-like [Salvia miltiorrhiza]XP_057792141.1 WAT1-related protein At3g30340-like [Salvia miltiorrhiza]XP_057792142.1 WAT1-related protein At3g30340-like [Salvia miltiorrhiza]XP_057792144.1 WAT1-related protein At3g30340-like [Salvia miltiorrhiza]XP_057792145.1 WAT1-related protein At3g30340-like [Salvia miltiorrhiza]XP_057792146.1 WAT1-related protein At3g30340-like [Salvia miltiorrhiza]XP_057792147.1 WAT1-related protein At3g30340-like [Salvia miltiorrhiza]XP_0